MKVRKRKDTGKWVVDFRNNGERVQLTLPNVQTEREAEQAAAAIMTDMFRQTYGFDQRSTSFAEFVAEVFLPYSKANKKSHRCDKIACKTLGQFFKKKSLKQITPTEVEKFKQWFLEKPIVYGPEDDRKEKPRTPATVNNHLRILSKILNMAVDAGEIQANPCKRVRALPVNNQRNRVLSPAEEKALLMAMDIQARPIVTTALNTGLRRGELFNLKWADVDFERKVLLVQESKSNRKRFVPLNKTVTDLLMSLARDSEYVFPSPVTWGKRVEIKRTFNRAVTHSKIGDLHFHDLRHTAATRMAEKGADAFTLCQIFGWSDIRMALRYTHATTDAVRRAVDAIG